MKAEAALGAAVIQQALCDAKATSACRAPERATARSFLYSTAREWREARALWFGIAGLREPPLEALRAAVDVVGEKDARSRERASTARKAAVAWLDRGASTQGEGAAA